MAMNRRDVLTAGLIASAATTSAEPAYADVPLGRRAETSTVRAIGGVYNDPFPGSIGGRWLLFRNNE
jgi:hypothetical protein